jgi:hypothetical protein
MKIKIMVEQARANSRNKPIRKKGINKSTKNRKINKKTK